MTCTVVLHKFWLTNPEREGGIKAYHPKICGFEKFLKKHRPKKICAIFARATINLLVTVETHLYKCAICSLADHGQKILCLTLKCASDGYANGDVESPQLSKRRPPERRRSYLPCAIGSREEDG